jgi:flagellar biosynthetic protein FliR
MLQELLPASIFAVLIVFVRMGGALMFLPGYGESYVSPRVRLLFALMVALVVTPVLAPVLPPEPDSAVLLALLILGEFFIGAFIGALAKLMMAALTVAGMTMAYMSSLANALVNDPASAQQGSIFASFMSVTALVVIFALNIHHTMLAALVDSYAVFPPGQAPPVGDFADIMSRTLARSFQIAMQLAAPFIAAGLIVYLGVGILARLMPQVQVFFVAMPVQIAKGIWLLMVILPAVIGWFVGAFEDIFSIVRP